MVILVVDCFIFLLACLHGLVVWVNRYSFAFFIIVNSLMGWWVLLVIYCVVLIFFF